MLAEVNSKVVLTVSLDASVLVIAVRAEVMIAEFLRTLADDKLLILH